MTIILAHFVINKIVHGGVGFVLGDQAKLRPQYWVRRGVASANASINVPYCAFYRNARNVGARRTLHAAARGCQAFLGATDVAHEGTRRAR